MQIDFIFDGWLTAIVNTERDDEAKTALQTLIKDEDHTRLIAHELIESKARLHTPVLVALEMLKKRERKTPSVQTTTALREFEPMWENYRLRMIEMAMPWFERHCTSEPTFRVTYFQRITFDQLWNEIFDRYAGNTTLFEFQTLRQVQEWLFRLPTESAALSQASVGAAASILPADKRHSANALDVARTHWRTSILTLRTIHTTQHAYAINATAVDRLMCDKYMRAATEWQPSKLFAAPGFNRIAPETDLMRMNSCNRRCQKYKEMMQTFATKAQESGSAQSFIPLIRVAQTTLTTIQNKAEGDLSDLIKAAAEANSPFKVALHEYMHFEMIRIILLDLQRLAEQVQALSTEDPDNIVDTGEIAKVATLIAAQVDEFLGPIVGVIPTRTRICETLVKLHQPFLEAAQKYEFAKVMFHKLHKWLAGCEPDKGSPAEHAQTFLKNMTNDTQPSHKADVLRGSQNLIWKQQLNHWSKQRDTWLGDYRRDKLEDSAVWPPKKELSKAAELIQSMSQTIQGCIARRQTAINLTVETTQRKPFKEPDPLPKSPQLPVAWITLLHTRLIDENSLAIVKQEHKSNMLQEHQSEFERIATLVTQQSSTLTLNEILWLHSFILQSQHLRDLEDLRVRSAQPSAPQSI